MPNPPPRKRFQIHLSTAIVLMFVAGVLIWANTQVQARSFIDGDPRFGWPYVAIFKNSIGGKNWFYFRWGIDVYFLRTATLIANALIAISLLTVICFLCECLIRRCSTRKES